MTKIFITGVTGYVGGDVLYALVAAHPEYEIAASVRTEEAATRVSKAYPKLRLVIGDLDSADLLQDEASKADIVINTADSDHAGALKALIAGLRRRTDDDAANNKPGYLIHTSGTGILLIDDFVAGRVGEHSDKIYNDWDGLSEVTSKPDEAPHRPTDKLTFAAGADEGKGKVLSAIIAPPAIYGPGRGPRNQRSVQAYDLTRHTLQRSKGFRVGKGLSRWCGVHVHDLSELFVLLVEAAVEGKNEVDGHKLWGDQAYYFAENGEFVWGDISAKIAEIAHSRGLIPSKEVEELSAEEVNAFGKWNFGLWGLNSRSRAIRANKLLGWTPKGRPLVDELPYIVESEAKALQEQEQQQP